MESIGLADMAFVEAKHPMGMLPLAEIRARADETFNEIVEKAIKWKPSRTSIAGLGKPPYPAPRLQFKGTYAELNKMFYDKGWSLGMPVIPPTTEAVAAMLKGTTHNPAEVVWVVPPRMGQLTVELVATLGTMAGCKPEHMPLLLALVKAFSHPDYDWRGSSTTTGPTVPIAVINGPIIDQLGIGYGTGVFGGEQPVNIALGYFVNLVGDIVGGSVAPDPDKSSHGTRADISALIIGENEKANPWKQTYAVEKGFKPTDSVVSVFSGYTGNCNVDHSSVTGKALLDTISFGVAGSASGISSCLTRYDKGYGLDNKSKYAFIFLGPEHAETIQKDFPTKKAAEEYVLKKAAAPYWAYAAQLCTPPKEFGAVTADTMIPRFTSTDQIHIVVTGGPGKQTQMFPSFPTNNRVVSVIVEK
jgi:hypothetical protein